jgi:hypothetical protein
MRVMRSHQSTSGPQVLANQTSHIPFPVLPDSDRIVPRTFTPVPNLPIDGPSSSESRVTHHANISDILHRLYVHRTPIRTRIFTLIPVDGPFESRSTHHWRPESPDIPRRLHVHPKFRVIGGTCGKGTTSCVLFLR